MSDDVEFPLGNAHHTLYSDEPWFLIVSDLGVRLESRFQSDAPSRSGWPSWTRTEFCVSKDQDSAVCHVPYDDLTHVLTVSRPSFVPEPIWAKALDVCRRLQAD